jgi:hypothetical protein
MSAPYGLLRTELLEALNEQPTTRKRQSAA